MRILDRERYWAYFKAYVICFTALVGLYVVIDAFSNFDEFTQRATGAVEIFRVMGRYYLVHMSEFYDRLCGVIGMMAAIFTVTWMQRNNELLAMLAAGISTHRVIRPVIISAVIVSGISVVNQELVMPDLAEELMKNHADDGTSKVRVASRYDGNRVLLHGEEADRGAQTVLKFFTTIPATVWGVQIDVEAKQATYFEENHPTAPLKGGWLLRGVHPSAPIPAGTGLDAKDLLIKLNDDRGFPRPLGEIKDLGGEIFFLRTTMSFKALTRRRQWYQYAATPDLIRGLTDPANEQDKADIAIFLHTRLLRPALSLALLCLTLPQVLGGYGRNMFVNLGISLGTAALFYGMSFLAQIPRFACVPLARTRRLGALDRLRLVRGLSVGRDSHVITSRSRSMTAIGASQRGWWRESELLILVVFVLGVYATRLTTLPLRGEESRRARVAIEMKERGDWIVPRQQGEPFLSRPPLGSWAIAAAAALIGKCDPLAVRLPTLLATLATTMLLYGYTRVFMSRLGALATGLVYATFGAVLQLGRLAETEATFTVFLAGALIVWHWGYLRAWPKTWPWVVGYALAALAALTKGPQAPCYFAGGVTAFLVLRRDWRSLFNGSHLLGLAVFTLIVGAWQIPCMMRLDTTSIWAIWSSDVTSRLGDGGFLAGLKRGITFNSAVFASLLPWSFLLLDYCRPALRRSLGDAREAAVFWATCVAVTLPTCWIVRDGATRYYMPMFPGIAVLVGIVVERAARPRRAT